MKYNQPHRVWSFHEAESHFSEVVERALEDEPQTVIRHGREAVVIVSASQYEKMIHPKESLVEFMRRSPLYGADDIEFGRDKSPVRR
ncbi:MAG: type II toxin-antitoxin system Phd/YefM family antitoxin [Zoogloeaceae bacterium]|nr:type II toxin-antitoxin system Phd/YefM family antitoxin [Zoogloeaceae bacterium]MCK6383989.1 type II toxin-antitoxin system Phd/YefM family antitoxin [Rhodocyclaceae bacterium]